MTQRLLDRSEDGEDLLMSKDVFLMNQLFELKELCGWEVKNRYRVYGKSASSSSDNTSSKTGEEDDDDLRSLGPVEFFAQESSECCERQCCKTCRSLELNIYRGSDTSSNSPILMIERNFQCLQLPWPLCFIPGWHVTVPWYFCARREKCVPKATIYGRKLEVMGYVRSPPSNAFQCQLYCVVTDPNDETELYRIGPLSRCCTSGCFCPCLDREEVEIIDVATDKQVGYVARLPLTVAECCGKTNRFEINFAGVSDPKRRLLLFGAAFVVDLTYWEPKDD